MEEMVIACDEVLNGLKLKAKCVNAEQHRNLSFYDLKLEMGCRVRRIEMFSREIALGLKSKTSPIITIIPEKGIVRLQVAADTSETLFFEDSYDESEMIDGLLPIFLGEDGEGKKLWVDFSKHPHTLVAGGTGSGKSTLLHTIIANVLKQNSAWLYLVDPKGGMEFGLYRDHVTFLAVNYEETIFMLEQLYEDMERRTKFLSSIDVSGIEEEPAVLNKILVVIDEVADLIMYDNDKSNKQKGRFERLIIMLAQKSRAVGIYIVLATQRPSVDILKGTIKANFPARIACRVSSATDSKVILDRNGAESLLGRGDAILINNDNDCVRFQAAYTNAKRVIA